MEKTKTKAKNNTYSDYDIFPGKVRLVKEDGSNVVIDRDDAIALAHDNGMNLVQVAYNKQDFPRAICKMINLSKYKYEQKKKEKAAKKAAKAPDVKEIVFTIRIDDGDKMTKISHVKDFLREGLKVKITIKLARRELSRIDFAKALMSNIMTELNGLAELDGNPSFNGCIISCVVKPVK